MAEPITYGQTYAATIGPPGVAAAASIRRFNERRGDDFVTPEALIRDASLILHRCGVLRSGGWVLRTVRSYMASRTAMSIPFGAYLLNRVQLNAQQRARALANSEYAYLLDYADPTGETAVRNVSREGAMS